MVEEFFLRRYRKTLAYIRHPIIKNIIHQRYRFPDRQSAYDEIDIIGQQFVCSQKLALVDNLDIDSLIQAISSRVMCDNGDKLVSPPDRQTLWIKGFEITREQAEQGSLGNFARISVRPVCDEYHLVITKIVLPAKYHPQRKRCKRSLPDWGHPLLRRVRKGHKFFSKEEIESAFARFQEDYPSDKVCSFKDGRLYIHVYERDYDTKQFHKRYVLESFQEDFYWYIKAKSRFDFYNEQLSQEIVA